MHHRPHEHPIKHRTPNDALLQKCQVRINDKIKRGKAARNKIVKRDAPAYHTRASGKSRVAKSGTGNGLEHQCKLSACQDENRGKGVKCTRNEPGNNKGG